MTDSGIIVDLVLIVAAAVAGGTVATCLRQPTIVGYIIGGVAVGPFTPGPEADISRIGFLTELGVAFLIKAFRYSGSVALLTGLALAQIGEFAFILARVGANQGVIDDFLFNLTIASAVITILINSLLLDSAPPVLAKIAGVSHFRALVTRRAQGALYASS